MPAPFPIEVLAMAAAAADIAAATPDSSAAGTKRKRRSEAASPVERPSRERKSIERYVNLSPMKTPPSKSITAEQGPGTMLKDIPNVVFNLSKRKADDETLQALHKILFGRRSNAHFLKRNIFQFSGFVWPADEVKQKMKVKEKLDKCNKYGLVDFCELLDIQIARATPKDEITAKLLEFLESPSVTRDDLLSEEKRMSYIMSRHSKELEFRNLQRAKLRMLELRMKELRMKAKRVCQTLDRGSSEKETKKRKSSLETEAKTRKRCTAKTKKGIGFEESLPEKEDEDEHISAAEEDSDEDVSIHNTLSNAEKDDHVTEQENGQAETMKTSVDNEYLSRPSSSKSKKENKTKGKNLSRPSSSKSKKENKTKGKSNDTPASKDKKLVKKQAAKPSAEVSTKEQEKPCKLPLKLPLNSLAIIPRKDKSSGKTDAGPSTEEIHSVITGGPSTEEIQSDIIGILANMDFDTTTTLADNFKRLGTTLADIIKRLAGSFNKDHMDIKREIKQILEEEMQY